MNIFQSNTHKTDLEWFQIDNKSMFYENQLIQ